MSDLPLPKPKSAEQELADMENKLVDAKIACTRAKTTLDAERAGYALRLKLMSDHGEWKDLRGTQQRLTTRDIESLVDMALADEKILQPFYEEYIKTLSEKENLRIKVEHLTRRYWDTRERL